MKSLSLCLMLVCLAAVCLIYSSQASTAQDIPFQLKVSVDNTRVMVGEPIIVRCVVSVPNDLSSVELYSYCGNGTIMPCAWFELYDSKHKLVVGDKELTPRRDSHLDIHEITTTNPYEIDYVIWREYLPKRQANIS